MFSDDKNKKIENSSIKWKDILWTISFVFLISCVHAYFSLSNLEAKIALKSFSVLDYANHQLYAQNFSRDWPNGIETLSLSAPVALVTWLHQATGIELLVLLKIAAFLQAFLLGLSISLLFLTLYKNLFGAFIFVTLCFVSPLTFLDLARLSNSFSPFLGHDLQWGYAFAFSFLSLWAFLEEKFFIAGLLLVFAVYCHLTVAFFMFLFMLPSLIFKRIDFSWRRQAGYMLFYILLLAPYLKELAFYNINGAEFPLEIYTKTLKVFSFHHFPLVMDSFSRRADKEFLPLVLSFIIFLVVMFQYRKIGQKNKSILFGILFTVILTVVYLIFSEYYPIGIIIKTQFHRMSNFIMFFSSMYLIILLLENSHGNILNLVFFGMFLVLFFLTDPGIPLILLTFFVIFNVRMSSQIRALITIGVISISAYYYLHFRVPLEKFVIGGNLLVEWPFSGVFFLLFSLSLLLQKRDKRNIAILLLVFSLGAVLVIRGGVGEAKWSRNHLKNGQDYVEVQRWALFHTNVDSLFLVDPSWGYGWRDFSKRSKMGSIREWLYTPISQAQNYNTYKHGVSIAEEFGVDLNIVKGDDIYNPDEFHYGKILTELVRNNFYSMPPDQLLDFCKRYQIDYVVMRNKYVKEDFFLRYEKLFVPAFKNGHFVVLEPLFS